MSAENNAPVRATGSSGDTVDSPAVYTPDVLANNHLGALAGAAAIVPRLLSVVPHVMSAVDFGCGLGTWLAALGKYQITDIDGYDGPWVPRDQLVIPEDRFHPVDLREDVVLPRGWDLALCLETAEHLPEDCADSLVALVTAAANLVLWSAAVPGQGGWYHLNEQPESYWQERFAAVGYRRQPLLDLVQFDDTVPSWYRRACLYVDTQ